MEQNNVQEQIIKNNGSSEKSWIACLLLCIFLGEIYGHKFYVGRVKEALTMWAVLIVSIILAFVGMGTAVLSSALLGFLVTGLGIVGMSAYCLIIIIDFFVILVGKFKDSEGKFVTK